MPLVYLSMQFAMGEDLITTDDDGNPFESFEIYLEDFGRTASLEEYARQLVAHCPTLAHFVVQIGTQPSRNSVWEFVRSEDSSVLPKPKELDREAGCDIVRRSPFAELLSSKYNV